MRVIAWITDLLAFFSAFFRPQSGRFENCPKDIQVKLGGLAMGKQHVDILPLLRMKEQHPNLTCTFVTSEYGTYRFECEVLAQLFSGGYERLRKSRSDTTLEGLMVHRHRTHSMFQCGLRIVVLEGDARDNINVQRRWVPVMLVDRSRRRLHITQFDGQYKLFGEHLVPRDLSTAMSRLEGGL